MKELTFINREDAEKYRSDLMIYGAAYAIERVDGLYEYQPAPVKEDLPDVRINIRRWCETTIP